MWTMDNSRVKSQQWVETNVNEIGDWSLVGSEDFDGNSTPDLIFAYKGLKPELRGANLVQYYEVKNSELKLKSGNSQSWLPWQTSLDTDSRPMLDLVAVRDLNDDGYPDLIWRKNRFYTNINEKGDLLAWIMKDRDFLTTMALPNKEELKWTPLFLDLENTGKTDILWRNIEDIPSKCKSTTSIWLMDKVYRLNTKIKEKVESC